MAVAETLAGAPRPAADRRSDTGRDRLRALATVLMVTGVLMIADAITTVTWEEPLTSLVALGGQAGLEERLAALRAAPPTDTERAALSQLRTSRSRIAFLARSLDRTAAEGSAIGEISLPRIDERLVVVKGSGTGPLRKGPGTYDGIGLPGTPGTAAIAGHRTTYGAPFHDIDKLRQGDPVTVAMPYATFTYRVEGTRIVSPDDLSVLQRRGYDRLILSACHPLYSAAQRIVVSARLVRTVPGGAAA